MTRRYMTRKGKHIPLRGGPATLRSEERGNLFVKSDNEWGHLFDSHEDKHSVGLESKGKSLQGKRKSRRNESGFGF